FLSSVFAFLKQNREHPSLGTQFCSTMLIQSRLDGHIDPNSDVQGSAGRAARTARIPGQIKFKADLDGLDSSGYGIEAFL
ncbi:hypothetical protein pipiens_013075, partial [Culex pipiens pipiens]